MKSARDPRPARSSPLDGVAAPRWAVIGVAVSLVVAVVVVGLAWSAIRTPNGRAGFVQTGRYSSRLGADFRANAPVSSVYPSGGVGTSFDARGQRVAAGPLYSRLIDSLHVDVTADVSRKRSARDVDARIDGRITVTTPEGWSSVVQVVADQPVAKHAVVPFDIALAPLRAQVANIGAQTGVGGNVFTITVNSALTVEPGSAPPKGDSSAGVDVARLPVKFTVDSDVMNAAPISPVTGAGRLGNRVTRAASMSALGFPVRVDLARVVFPGLALVALAAVLMFALVLFAGVGLSGSERIAARYRARIVDVAMSTSPPGPIVLVSSVAELARVARAEQSVILHQAMPDGSHRYRVVLGAVTYEYQTVPEHAGHASDLLAENEE
ncbi:MAG: hypothetical protein WD296_07495 [Acidimicrobiia bacterium]